MSDVSNAKMVRTEFAAAINQIANERKIPVESIYEAIRQALVSAYRKQYGPLDEGWHYYTNLDESSGESKIIKAPVLEMNEETLEATKWDETKAEDVTPAGFGRIAAQTAKQVILQKIRESEKDQIITEYTDRIGEVLTAQILRMDGRIVILDIGRGQGYMPPEEQMRGEFYRMNNRISVLVKEIRDTHKGKQVVVSRSDKQLVAKLFEREVPEVSSGAVKIELIAREAGVRTKLAVKSTQEGVDPVGSCVGQRGVRVQEVIRELNNEKLDIIPYSEDLKLLLQAALAPAENLTIELNPNNTAVVTAPDDQLSLAIGRGGQNVRLAAKLTGLKITIKSAGGAVKSHVTGQEEYEIDTFKGIDEVTRALLVEHKLTTLTDLSRFKDKWQQFEISDDQKKILADKVEAFDAEQAEYERTHPRSEAGKLIKPEVKKEE
ncbi:MAG: transcription termination/antitermination protein NusA [Candidatus Pacebacteria bacterium CG_4_10_14_0_8_um_filter_43_12]|nr:MAG: transcription termination/antitermination protein NusA [Candidatus Pacebacteria bacterium CG_4_10_14_0_8_um_filter_43_12]